LEDVGTGHLRFSGEAKGHLAPLQFQIMACLFYLLVAAAVVGTAVFMWSFWHEAKAKDWNWITESSRAMYVDVSKTVITASGIAVALVASDLSRTLDPVAKQSARVAVICLITSIVAGLATILALTRGHERARSRNIETRNNPEEGQLTDLALLFILIPGGVGLCAFLVGFLFLGRVTFHI
jgi:hypothetical protein